MNAISGAVYDPPREGLPTLAVVFGADGDVLIARCLDSRSEAEALLAQIQKAIRERIDEEIGDDDA
jgi:hypothetical protein